MRLKLAIAQISTSLHRGNSMMHVLLRMSPLNSMAIRYDRHAPTSQGVHYVNFPNALDLGFSCCGHQTKPHLGLWLGACNRPTCLAVSLPSFPPLFFAVFCFKHIMRSYEVELFPEWRPPVSPAPVSLFKDDGERGAYTI